MKKNPRHDRMLRFLTRCPGREATVGELAREFAVSRMTVRRDLAALAAAGRLTRTHGGAVVEEPAVVEFAFRRQHDRMLREKRAIARAAATLVRPGMAVSLDTGTTTLEIARRLDVEGEVTVLTSSLAVAASLYARDNVKLVLLGGTVRRNDPDLFGPLTEDNLKRFRVHLAFLGADAVSPEGFYTTDPNVARISRAMIDNARQRVVVADSGKFGRTAFARFAEFAQIDRVVTDGGCPLQVRAWLKRKPCAVSYAPLQDKRSGKRGRPRRRPERGRQ